MSKIALITGIAGQDGSYLSELLLEKNYEIHGFVKKTFSLNNKSHIWRIKNIIKKIKLHKVDINNLDKIYELINKIKPKEVYHLAAQANNINSFKDELNTFDVNFNFTHKILHSVFKINKKTKFFFASSSEIFSSLNKKKLMRTQRLIHHLLMAFLNSRVII